MPTPLPPAAPAREYPDRPIVGVGAITFTAEGRVVLVRRARPPSPGEWSLPGGVLELGESIHEGLVREVREETGLDIAVGPFVDVFERVATDADGRVRYHYVVLDYLCRVRGGTPDARSDASAIALADPADLSAFALAESALAVIRKAWAMAGLPPTELLVSPCR